MALTVLPPAVSSTGLTLNILMWNMMAAVCDAAVADAEAGGIQATAWAWPAVTLAAAWLRRHPVLCQTRRPAVAARGLPLASAPGDAFWIQLARLLNLAAHHVTSAPAAAVAAAPTPASAALEPDVVSDEVVAEAMAIGDDEDWAPGDDEEEDEGEEGEEEGEKEGEEEEEEEEDDDDDGSSLDLGARSAATDSGDEDDEEEDDADEEFEEEEDEEDALEDADYTHLSPEATVLPPSAPAVAPRAAPSPAPPVAQPRPAADVAPDLRLRDLLRWVGDTMRATATAPELAWLTAFDAAAQQPVHTPPAAWPQRLASDLAAASTAQAATFSQPPADDGSAFGPQNRWRLAMVLKLGFWLGEQQERTARTQRGAPGRGVRGPPPLAFNTGARAFVAYPSASAGNNNDDAHSGANGNSAGKPAGRKPTTSAMAASAPAETPEERQRRRGSDMRRLAEARLKVRVLRPERVAPNRRRLWLTRSQRGGCALGWPQSEVGQLEEALAKLQTSTPAPPVGASPFHLVVDGDILISQLALLEHVVATGIATVHVPASGALSWTQSRQRGSAVLMRSVWERATPNSCPRAGSGQEGRGARQPTGAQGHPLLGAQPAGAKVGAPSTETEPAQRAFAD